MGCVLTHSDCQMKNCVEYAPLIAMRKGWRFKSGDLGEVFVSIDIKQAWYFIYIIYILLIPLRKLDTSSNCGIEPILKKQEFESINVTVLAVSALNNRLCAILKQVFDKFVGLNLKHVWLDNQFEIDSKLIIIGSAENESFYL